MAAVVLILLTVAVGNWVRERRSEDTSIAWSPSFAATIARVLTPLQAPDAMAQAVKPTSACQARTSDCPATTDCEGAFTSDTTCDCKTWDEDAKFTCDSLACATCDSDCTYNYYKVIPPHPNFALRVEAHTIDDNIDLMVKRGDDPTIEVQTGRHDSIRESNPFGDAWIGNPLDAFGWVLTWFDPCESGKTRTTVETSTYDVTCIYSTWDTVCDDEESDDGSGEKE
ncbi:hypothetical protein ACFLTM_05840 [Candidatus Bipolaricaulota bacterium]